ncbi:MAG: outer membrane beta-barrel protein [Pseudomonadota bacterium]
MVQTIPWILRHNGELAHKISLTLSVYISVTEFLPFEIVLMRLRLVFLCGLGVTMLAGQALHATAQTADPFAQENAVPLPQSAEPAPRANIPLSPITTGRAQAAGPQPRVTPQGRLLPQANQPVGPVQGTRNQNAVDPFSPLGLRAGRFTLFPELTQSVGNTTSRNGGSGQGAFSQTEGRLRLQSDFSRHALTGEIGGTVQKFLEGDEDTISLADGQIEYRHDLRQATVLRMGLGFNFIGDLGSDSVVADPTTANTLNLAQNGAQTAITGFAEVNHNAGVHAVLLRGAFERVALGNATLANGGKFDQSDQNYWLTSLTGRFTYNNAAVISPFLEGTIGQRVFDERVDRNGLQRNATILALRTGLTFDRGEKFNGEIAVGYGREDLQDQNLTAIEGLTLDGALNWSPLRETLVTATASARFDTSSDAADSGVLTHTFGLGVTRTLRPNWTLNGQITASWRDFQGSGRAEQIIQLEAGSEWQMNRNAALFATLGHEMVESNDSLSDDASTTVRIGVRLRR